MIVVNNLTFGIKVKFSRFWLVFSLFFYSEGLISQTQFDRFNHISTSDKFILNSVTSIDQDEKGLIWFGTRNGLMKYDGIELKVVKRVEGDFNKRRVNDIFCVLWDSTSGIWMGTQNGLSLYDNRAESFKIINKVANLGSGTHLVYDVLRVKPNEIWLGTHAGLIVYQEDTEMLKIHNFIDSGKTSNSQITQLYQTSNGDIWLCTNDGLRKAMVHENGDLEFSDFKIDWAWEETSARSRISSIQEDHHGNLWVGTRLGLYYFNTTEQSFELYVPDRGQKLTSEVVTALTMDHSNRLWVGTYEGLNILSENQELLSKVEFDPKVTNGLKGRSVKALYTDSQGGVWIASYYGGVNYWKNKKLNFNMVSERSGGYFGHIVVGAIAEDENSNIYIGTEGDGINIFNPRTNVYKKISVLADDFPLRTVKDFLYDGNGKFWIATFGQGLIYLDMATLEFKVFDKTTSEHPISSNETLTIAKAHDGNIWIGVLNGGLNLFDVNTEEFRVFKKQSLSQVIPNNNVRATLVTKKGDLLVGTSNGLAVLSKEDYDRRDFNFQRFEMENETEQSLYVHDLIQDEKGRVWVCTKGQGLMSIEGKNITPSSLEVGNTVFSATEDTSKGILWLSTSDGIVSFNPDTGQQELFDRGDGVPPNEFSRGAGLIASDGSVYFGGASGVTTFHPSTLGLKDDYAPDAVITGFALSERLLSSRDSLEILTQAIEYTKELTLNYDQNFFTIHFSMPNYAIAGKNTYKYRLKGLGDEWKETINSFASFTIQQGGNYEFQVKGVNNDGMESANATSLIIKVKDAPWKTWWAYAFYGIIILAGFFMYVYFKQSRLKLQHQLELEQQAFTQQEEVNRQKLEFFTNISHEFRTPLTLISGPLEKIIEEYSGPSVIFRQLQVARKNTDRLYRLINELMDFRKLENQQMKLEAAEGNIVRFIYEIFLSFRVQAKLNKIEYTFHTEQEEVNVYFDRDKLEKVVYNLISNAFKATSEGGEIKVKITSEEEVLKVSVIDNGDGIPQQYLDKIFDRFYEIPTLDKGDKSGVGTGIGLAIVKSIMTLHKGDIEVASQVGEGTKFTFHLKKGRNHLVENEIIASFKNSEDIEHYRENLNIEAIIEPNDFIENDKVEDSKKNTILLVEDNEEIAKFTYGILSSYYNVYLSKNGAEAFKSAISSYPDLIISDVMMPVMDGIEFCSKIKSDIRTSHIPVILLTARTSLIYKYEGLESGADEYLTKPFKIKELLLKCHNTVKNQARLRKKFSKEGSNGGDSALVSSIDETMMNKAIQIIKKNIDNEFFSIQMLCDDIGLSRTLLFTKFKAWTGYTPAEYILSVRMKQAAALLEQGKVSVSEVGYMVGYKSANHFSKSFKKFYSLSPTEYAHKFNSEIGM